MNAAADLDLTESIAELPAIRLEAAGSPDAVDSFRVLPLGLPPALGEGDGARPSLGGLLNDLLGR